jgi:hypothetical protein
MKPRRHAISPRFLAPAVLLLTLAATGCATAGAASHPPPQKHVINVTFVMKNGLACPGSVTVANPASQCPGSQDCLTAYNGDKVDFVGVRGLGVPNENLHFSICFDPFLQRCFEATNSTLDLLVSPQIPGNPADPKTYTFNVLKENCPVIDPRIIVRP